MCQNKTDSQDDKNVPLACRILRQHVTERIGIVSEWSTPFPLDQANGKFRQRDFDAG